MALTLRYAVRSDRGLVRGNNEDSVYAGPRLLAIADGMGGHAAGEVASKIVISTLEELDEDRPLGDLLTALREAVEAANEGIAEQVAANHDLDGMGTTLTALRFSNGQVGLAHVGDSRAYLMRGEPALADHPRRHLRAVARRRRPADAGRGGEPPAQVGDPAGPDRRAASSLTSRSARPAPAIATCCAPTD